MSKLKKKSKKIIKPELSELEKLLAEPDWKSEWYLSLPPLPSLLKEPYDETFDDEQA